MASPVQDVNVVEPADVCLELDVTGTSVGGPLLHVEQIQTSSITVGNDYP